MIMNNLFKKNTEKSEMVQSPEVKIISAKEALTISSSKWSNVSNEEIFEKINSVAQNGQRKVYFWNSKITNEQAIKFKKLGYQVEILTSISDNIPYFKLSW